MNRLPSPSGRDLVKALVGYTVVRQKSSHVRLRCGVDPARKPATVPLATSIKPGTLRAIPADAGLTRDQFIELLK